MFLFRKHSVLKRRLNLKESILSARFRINRNLVTWHHNEVNRTVKEFAWKRKSRSKMSSVMQKIRREQRSWFSDHGISKLSDHRIQMNGKRPKKEGSDRKTIPKRPVGGGFMIEWIHLIDYFSWSGCVSTSSLLDFWPNWYRGGVWGS